MSERSFDEIVAITNQRRDADTALKRLMVETAERYENVDYILPGLASADSQSMPDPTPALIADAIDYGAMKASSVHWSTFVPALDPTKDTGAGSREYAAIRRRAIESTHFESRTPLLMRRMLRHLLGYHTMAAVVVPDWDLEIPRIEVRDPLYAYPEPRSGDDFRPPRDIAFVYGRSAAWLRSQYPNQASAFLGHDIADSVMFDVVEWIDEYCTVIGIVGERNPRWQSSAQLASQGVWGTRGRRVTGVELRRWPNRSDGLVPAVCPSGVSLSRAISKVMRMLRIPDLMARLQMLEIEAGEKMVYPDPYIIGRQGQMPTLVGGHWKDGRDGDMNIVLDAEGVGQLQSIPGPATSQINDRLERNFRISTGLVPAAGGETYGALRTGRGIDSMLAASVDLHTQEIHELVEATLPHLNSVVLAMYKAQWPDRRYVLFSGLPGDDEMVEFTPATHVESHLNAIAYPIPGAGVNETIVGIAQSRAAEFISQRTARIMHPFVKNPDGEERQINLETVDEVAKVSFLDQLKAGTLEWEVVEDVRAALAEGRPWSVAVGQAQKAAQERAAEKAAAEQAMAPADAALAPQLQPGMNGPGPSGPGGEVVPPTIAGPSTSQDNYRELLRAVRAGSTLGGGGGPQ